MKICIPIFLSVFLFQGLVGCKTAHELHTARYSFQQPVATDEFASIAGLLLNSVSYSVVTDGKIARTTTNFDDPGEGPIHVQVNGPRQALLDIEGNRLQFDQSRDSVYQFWPMKFIPVNQTAVINNFPCRLLLSERGDSLFISDKLPSYVNPFFLTQSSISAGVVKAVLAGNVTYSLSNYNRSAGKMKEQLPIAPEAKVVGKKNLFFDTE